MKPRASRLAGFALSVLLIGVIPTMAALPEPLAPSEGIAWRLVELDGASLLPEQPVTLRLADGQADGSDGCNRYRRGYHVDGAMLRFDERGLSTMMACPSDVAEQARAFAAVLDATRQAQVKLSYRLELKDAQGRLLAVFEAEPQVLADTRWQVSGYNNGRQAVVSVLMATSISLDFHADARLAGSAGCNRYHAGYSQSGTAVTIGPAASTRRACAEPAGIMQQEALYLQALERVASARIEADRLELRAADGTLQVVARRR